MKSVALVHDNFAQMGGAERVAEVVHRNIRDANVLTTLAAREKLSPELQRTAIMTTWMQSLPQPGRYYRHYFLLYPLAIEGIDLSSYDLVISSCFGYAKGVKKRSDAIHVCYCHNPMRWVWRFDDYAEKDSFGSGAKLLLKPMLRALRVWDRRAATRPDYFIANGAVVADRIKSFYGRDSEIIPPPIDTERFRLTDVNDDYFLILARLVPYKRIDLAVEACTRLGRNLLVVGDGPDRRRLESLAGPTVKFLGRQTDGEVERYAAGCKALLFPGEEDFGMAPLELNSAGRPVIAYAGGGALETVVENETGIFFREQSVDSLARAIESFDHYSWDRSRLRRHAEQYSYAAFSSRLAEFLHRKAGYNMPLALAGKG